MYPLLSSFIESSSIYTLGMISRVKNSQVSSGALSSSATFVSILELKRSSHEAQMEERSPRALRHLSMTNSVLLMQLYFENIFFCGTRVQSSFVLTRLLDLAVNSGTGHGSGFNGQVLSLQMSTRSLDQLPSVRSCQTTLHSRISASMFVIAFHDARSPIHPEQSMIVSFSELYITFDQSLSILLCIKCLHRRMTSSMPENLKMKTPNAYDTMMYDESKPTSIPRMRIEKKDCPHVSQTGLCPRPLNIPSLPNIQSSKHLPFGLWLT